MLRVASRIAQRRASCCGYDIVDGQEYAFEVRPSHFKFGPGIRREMGLELRDAGMSRVAVFTDKQVRAQAWLDEVLSSMRREGVEYVVYDDVAVEPTDESFMDAAKFVIAEQKGTAGGISGILSVGGGSVMDTAKAANLFSENPDADFFDFVNAPIGKAHDVPKPLKYHLAMPTTAGTGSEATGLAICDIKSLGAKTGIGHRRLIPSLAVIDPEVTFTMPLEISACTGWDVVSHAVESYTARPFTARPAMPPGKVQRSLHQGANPFSDFGTIETLRIAGDFFARATLDMDDVEARTQMAYAATLAGVAMGNAGTALPHGMSYAVSGRIKDMKDKLFVPDAYKPITEGTKSIVPHGMSVVVGAPASFEEGAKTNPYRHLHAAALLGNEDARKIMAGPRGGRDVSAEDAAAVIFETVCELMRVTRMPNGLQEIGYSKDDIPDLVRLTLPQKRVIGNAPFDVNEEVLTRVFERSFSLW